jgi:hypothetical protein
MKEEKNKNNRKSHLSYSQYGIVLVQDVGVQPIVGAEQWRGEKSLQHIPKG